MRDAAGQPGGGRAAGRQRWLRSATNLLVHGGCAVALRCRAALLAALSRWLSRALSLRSAVLHRERRRFTPRVPWRVPTSADGSPRIALKDMPSLWARPAAANAPPTVAAPPAASARGGHAAATARRPTPLPRPPSSSDVAGPSAAAAPKRAAPPPPGGERLNAKAGVRACTRARARWMADKSAPHGCTVQRAGAWFRARVSACTRAARATCGTRRRLRAERAGGERAADVDRGYDDPDDDEEEEAVSATDPAWPRSNTRCSAGASAGRSRPGGAGGAA